MVYVKSTNVNETPCAMVDVKSTNVNETPCANGGRQVYQCQRDTLW